MSKLDRLYSEKIRITARIDDEMSRRSTKWKRTPKKKRYDLIHAIMIGALP